MKFQFFSLGIYVSLRMFHGDLDKVMHLVYITIYRLDYTTLHTNT